MACRAPATESGQQLLERILTDAVPSGRLSNWRKAKIAESCAMRSLQGLIQVNCSICRKNGVGATVEQLASTDKDALAIGPFGSNLKVEDYRKEGVPLVFVRNIRSNIFDGPETLAI